MFSDDGVDGSTPRTVIVYIGAEAPALLGKCCDLHTRPGDAHRVRAISENSQKYLRKNLQSAPKCGMMWTDGTGRSYHRRQGREGLGTSQASNRHPSERASGRLHAYRLLPVPISFEVF